MKSSSRDLLLVPKIGKVNKKRRYFNLRSAINRAMREAVEEGQVTVIYDINFGRDVAVVSCHPSGVKVDLLTSPRIFNRLWSR